tara:strand:- start:1593 stop:2420 length:828 start_codon:yes stop_codon:yes gene_type:complete
MADSTQDPNNKQVPKGFVFNETGNIMMATTDMQSQEIEKEVRDCFAEVSVFFAAMTKALERNAASDMKGEETITITNADSTTSTVTKSYNYSLYDYAEIKKIIDNSGCFVQVNEEDVTHSTQSFGMTFSKELLEAVLGLATGTGELAFAKAMVSSVGKAGLKISERSSSDETRVANIIFVCEYLLGMPVISAIVITADSKQDAFQAQVGPCVSVHHQQTDLTIHKDTYMFVTPAFIKQYSGDLISGIKDPEFEELTEIFTGYLNPSTASSGSNTP